MEGNCASIVGLDLAPIQGVGLGFELDSWRTESNTEHYLHLELFIFRLTITITIQN
jgi:hypothetical protein